jgi:hypothetical protein
MGEEPVYEVVAPVGRVVREEIPVNAFPADLSNSTVGFVWDYLFKGPILFDAIRNVVDANHAGVRYVDYDYFGNVHCDPKDLDKLSPLLDAAKVDVAVVGIGA